MVRYRIGAAALLAVCAGTTVSAASAAPLFFDNFDGETQGVNASLTNFTIKSGSIDVIGNGFADEHPGNGNYVDLDGSTNGPNPASDIVTKMSFGPGSYTVSFSLAGSVVDPKKTTQVNFGSYTNTFSPTVGSDFSTISFSTTLSASSNLEFIELGDSTNNGNVLDNVMVSASGSVSAVPLPASAPMFGAALLVLGTVGYGLRRGKGESAEV